MVTLLYVVAGLSSRFRGKIKQFARVGPNDETLIEYSLNQALKAGFSKIIFIVGDLTEQPFKEKFGNEYKNIPIEYAKQDFNKDLRDKPWGTTDALCSAIDLIKEPIIFCNGDDLYGENSFKTLYNHLKNSSEDATLSYKLLEVLPKEGSVNRGIFKIENNFVTDLKEVFDITSNNYSEKELTKDSPCSMNIFALSKDTINKLNERLKTFKENHNNNRTAECLLPVELSNLINNNQIKMKIYPTNDKWFGVTNPEDELIVKEILIKQKNLK